MIIIQSFRFTFSCVKIISSVTCIYMFSYLVSNTVLSLINGHHKRRIPLISGRFYFSWQNSGQTFIKNFLKNGKVFCLADTINNFEVILAAREGDYLKRFVKYFLNVAYVRYLEILHARSLFVVSNFLASHWTVFS